MKKLCLFIFSLLLIFAAGCELDTSEIDRETELEYITVDTSEAKVIYHINEEFDKTGLKVIGHYSNGTTKEEDLSLADVPPVDTSEKNPEVMVTVTFNNKHCSFPIVVKEATEESIVIKTKPYKIFYHSGEDIDLEGLSAVIKYSDGSESSELTKESFGEHNIKVGNVTSDYDVQYQDIIVPYKDNLELTYKIYVFKDSYINVNSINISEVEKIPTTYRQGKDELIFDNVKLSFSYGVGSNQSRPITDFHISPMTIKDLPLGTNHISVSVKGTGDTLLTKQFDISVIDGYVAGAKLNSEKKCFYDGDKISFLDNESDDENVYTFYEIIRNENTKIETPRPLPFGNFNNLKYSYLGNNNEINFESLTDEEKENLFNQANSIGDTLSVSGTGPQKIHFYYKYLNEYSKKYEIYYWSYDIGVLESPLDHITAVFNQGNKLIPLEENPNVDFENKYGGSWNIQAYFLNETSKEIDPKYCTFSFNEKLEDIKKAKKEGIYTATINVTYKLYNKSYATEVDPIIKYGSHVLTRAELKKSPNKTKYVIGDTLDLTGMQYILHYSDGEEETVTYLSSTNLETSLTDNTIANDTKDIKVYITSAHDICLTLPIDVVAEEIEKITIEPKAKNELKFRKGKTYTFTNFFDLKAVYNKINKIETLPINANLKFNLFTNNDGFVVLGVIYTVGDKKYYASYKSNQNTGVITLLDPAPKTVEITGPSPLPLTYADYISSSKYTVYYEDDSYKIFNNLEELKKNKFSEDCTTTNGELKLTYNDENSDCNGDTITNKVITLDLSNIYNNTIYKISIDIDGSLQSNYLRGNQPKTFNVLAHFYNGKTVKIVSNDVKVSNNLSSDNDILTSFEETVNAEYMGLSAELKFTLSPNIVDLVVYKENIQIDGENCQFSKGISLESITKDSFKYKIKAIDANNDYAYSTELNANNITPFRVSCDNVQNSTSKVLNIYRASSTKSIRKITITVESE